jgi:hypothetical protein
MKLKKNKPTKDLKKRRWQIKRIMTEFKIKTK